MLTAQSFDNGDKYRNGDVIFVTVVTGANAKKVFTFLAISAFSNPMKPIVVPWEWPT